ncbi:MAG TPA: hypothetical protein VF745_08760 [Steroidobacteraceae bacterium]
MPISVEARRSTGIDASEVGSGSAVAREADACDVCTAGACGAATVSGALGIAAAAAVPRAVGCAEAGASVGAKGATDWLQEAAANPRAAKMSGRKILIMGAL